MNIEIHIDRLILGGINGRPTPQQLSDVGRVIGEQMIANGTIGSGSIASLAAVPRVNVSINNSGWQKEIGNVIANQITVRR